MGLFNEENTCTRETTTPTKRLLYTCLNKRGDDALALNIAIAPAVVVVIVVLPPETRLTVYRRSYMSIFKIASSFLFLKFEIFDVSFCLAIAVVVVVIVVLPPGTRLTV